MIQVNKNFWYAVALLVGTIIGAGIFGLPYVVASSGFIIGIFWMLVLGALSLYLHLLYGEIVLRTPGKRRYTGLVRKYFSKRLQIFASLTNIIGTLGVLLAYLVVGGVFLYNLFHFWLGGGTAIYVLIFWAIASIGVIFTLPLAHKINFFLVALLLLMIIVLGFWALPQVRITHLGTISWFHFFVPYGAILFSLSGGSAIPEIVEILKRKPRVIKKAILLGSLIPLCFFIFFIFFVIGIAGKSVTPEAIAVLESYLGRSVVIFGSFLGLLAVITSFFTIGVNLKKIFWYDYKINRYLASLITIAVPLVLFYLGARNFIEIISLLGVFLIGIDGILITKLFYRARQQGKKRVSYRLPFASFMPYVVLVILILGVILELYFKIGKKFL